MPPKDSPMTGTDSAQALTLFLSTTMIPPSIHHWLLVEETQIQQCATCAETQANFTGHSTTFNLAAEIHSNKCPSGDYIAASCPSLWHTTATPEALYAVNINLRLYKYRLC